MAEEKRPEWMTSITSIVNEDEYLLGRKIDKTFELSQEEKAKKAREAQIDLLAKDKIKLSDDPILDLERRRRELKMEIIQNPVLLKQLRDRLLRDEKIKSNQSPKEVKKADDQSGSYQPTDSSVINNKPADRQTEYDKCKELRHGDRRDRERSNERSRHKLLSNLRSEDRGRRYDNRLRHSETSGEHKSHRRSRSPISRHNHRHGHRDKDRHRHEHRYRSHSPKHRR